MATDPADPLGTSASGSPAAVEDFTPSPLTATRAQAIQRLQVGLFGLGSMVLLVGLASVVQSNARQSEAQVVPEAAPTVATSPEEKQPSDPLAEAGIVPEMPAQADPIAVTPPPPPPPGTGDAAPVVP